MCRAHADIPAYALYFDHRRRTQPEFRRELRRIERRQARAEKELAQQETVKQRELIKMAVEMAKSNGFPSSVEEKEAYFMKQVSLGEALVADCESCPIVCPFPVLPFCRIHILTRAATKTIEAAMHFYMALKVYPTPTDLLRIYDTTVPKVSTPKQSRRERRC